MAWFLYLRENPDSFLNRCGYYVPGGVYLTRKTNSDALIATEVKYNIALPAYMYRHAVLVDARARMQLDAIQTRRVMLQRAWRVPCVSE